MTLAYLIPIAVAIASTVSYVVWTRQHPRITIAQRSRERGDKND